MAAEVVRQRGGDAIGWRCCDMQVLCVSDVLHPDIVGHLALVFVDLSVSQGLTGGRNCWTVSRT